MELFIKNEEAKENNYRNKAMPWKQEALQTLKDNLEYL